MTPASSGRIFRNTSGPATTRSGGWAGRLARAANTDGLSVARGMAPSMPAPPHKPPQQAPLTRPDLARQSERKPSGPLDHPHAPAGNRADEPLLAEHIHGLGDGPDGDPVLLRQSLRGRKRRARRELAAHDLGPEQV